MTEPATAEEIEAIVAELMGDGGPPLMVTVGRRQWAAGSRPLSKDRAEQMVEQERAWRKAKADSYERQRERLIDNAYRDHPGHGRPQQVDKLAGDVFHGELERMDLSTAIRKAMAKIDAEQRQLRAAEAIERAVRGTTRPPDDGAGTSVPRPTTGR